MNESRIVTATQQLDIDRSKSNVADKNTDELSVLINQSIKLL